MKPLIYLTSFLGHYLDAGSRKAAHSYAKNRVSVGAILEYDLPYAIAIIVFLIGAVGALVWGVML